MEGAFYTMEIMLPNLSPRISLPGLLLILVMCLHRFHPHASHRRPPEVTDGKTGVIFPVLFMVPSSTPNPGVVQGRGLGKSVSPAREPPVASFPVHAAGIEQTSREARLEKQNMQSAFYKLSR